MRLDLTAFLLSMLLITQAANAQFITGNRMEEFCRLGAPADNFVGGFAAAVTDMADLQTPGQVCMQTGVTIKQLQDLLCLELKDHPESRHFTEASLFLNVLKQKYPCKNATP